MNWLDIYKHLLPRGKAWSLTAAKQLREFFDGLSGLPEDIQEFFDDIWLDIFPQTTRELSIWETQWGLPDSNITEQERRDRLAAQWKMDGGQSPSYLQGVLRDAGFDVFIHEWWVPDTDPPTLRNPFTVLRDSNTAAKFLTECGEPLAECGEPTMEAGETLDPPGYPLVNKLFSTELNFLVECGEPIAECGEPVMEAGNFDGFLFKEKEYIIPDDVTKWPYFLYFGGQVFGDVATVDLNRRDEFENLCLKICPGQQWLGIIVKYS